MRKAIEKNGFQIEFSHHSGVVESGSLLQVSTNVPASISVALGTGSLESYTEPIVIDRDLVVRVVAVADVQTSTGSAILVESIQPYAVLKSSYPILRISEVYPSPTTGETEWVELWNPNAESVSLLGWTLDDVEDAGSKPLRISSGVVLHPGGFVRLENLPIALNNDGDDVRLLAPNGRLSHTVTYGSVKKGTAVAMLFSDDARQTGQCPTVHATPGSENRCAQALPKAKKPSTRKTTIAVNKHDVRYRNLIVDEIVDRVQRTIFERLTGVPRLDHSFAYQLLLLCIVVLFLLLFGAITRFLCIQRDCP